MNSSNTHTYITVEYYKHGIVDLLHYILYTPTKGAYFLMFSINIPCNLCIFLHSDVWR